MMRGRNSKQGAPMPFDSPPHVTSADSATQEGTAPAPHELTLIGPDERRIDNPPWELVERVLRQLDPELPHSFCILDAHQHSFVQTLRGFNGYHLESRAYIDEIHFRASYLGGSDEVQHLLTCQYTNDGQARDLLVYEDVVAAFRSFFQSRAKADWLDWRVIEVDET